MKLPIIGVVVALSLVAGCNTKVKFEKSDDYEPMGHRIYTVDGPAREQKIKIEINSTESPVSYWVVLEKDKPANLDALDRGTKIPNTLSSGGGSKTYSVEVTVPAKSAFCVIVGCNDKKTSATVKINSL